MSILKFNTYSEECFSNQDHQAIEFLVENFNHTSEENVSCTMFDGGIVFGFCTIHKNSDDVIAYLEIAKECYGKSKFVDWCINAVESNNCHTKYSVDFGLAYINEAQKPLQSIRDPL